MAESETTSDFLERWLDELPDDEIKREIDDLQTKLNELNAQISTRREALALKERYRELHRPRLGPTVGPRVARPGSIPETILTIMESEPQVQMWSIGDLHASMVIHNWMANDDQTVRSLGAALSRMVANGDLVRVGRGLYKRPAQSAGELFTPIEGGEPG